MKATTTKSFAILAACVCMLFSAMNLSAITVFDTFGPLDEATFGGQGIPNDEVAISKQIIDDDVTITIALSATQRFSNPALTNDGAATYFATPGSNFGGAGESATEGALWNFNAYINVDGPATIDDYEFSLLYDFDPAFDNSFASLGVINVNNSVLLEQGPGATLSEGSQNLLFGFLAVSTPGFISPPAGSFDPNASGEYTFAIGVTDGFFPLESVAINVVVVPEPSTTVLIALMGGFLVCRQRRS